MPDVPPDLSRFLSDAKKLVDEYQVPLTIIVLPLLGLMAKLFLDRRRNIPNLQFELADAARIEGGNDLTFRLKVTNIGGQPATDVRYTWNQRSSCTMTPVPANLMIRNDDQRCFEFSMRAADLIGRGLAGGGFEMLGWLELTYYAGWGLRKRTGKAIVIGDSPDVPVKLAKVPRKPWGEILVPLGRWQEKRIRDKDIQNLDRALQRSREYLEARGIRVELLVPRESFYRLLAELQNRGWQWSYGPGGRGYEVYAKKRWPLSPGATIRLSANTMVDAATIVVASAIEADEQRR